MTSIIPPGFLGGIKTTTRHGIVLEVFPARDDPSGDTQHALYRVQRAPDSTGTPGSPSTGDILDIGNIPSGRRLKLVDYLPNDGKRRFYRALAYSYGYSNSPPTGWVDAEPDVVIQGTESPAQVGTVFSNVLLVDDDDLDQASKKLRLGVNDWQIQHWDSNQQVDVNIAGSGTYLFNNGAEAYVAYAMPKLPPGATVYKAAARLYRATTGDTAELELWWSQSNPGSTAALAGTGIQATLGSTVTGAWATVTSSSFTPRVHDALGAGTTSAVWVPELSLISAGAAGSRFAWLDLYYRVTTVGESL